jgi:hypothetical protein
LLTVVGHPARHPCIYGARARLYHCVSGALAQLGERLLCKQEVAGSIPAGSISQERAAPRAPAGLDKRRE